MAYVNLTKMPNAKREYIVSFETLAGGLNLHELDYRINNNESPEMKNMLWREGVLSSRDGQVWVSEEDAGVSGFVTAFDKIWNDAMFIHAGESIYSVDPVTGLRTLLYTGENMTEHGTFFLYNQKLYYKTRGFYVEINYQNGAFSAADVLAYTPITYINCSPENGSGIVYQPENFISPRKELWYNAAFTLNTSCSNSGLMVVVESSYFRGKTNTPGTYVFTYMTEWSLNGETVDPFDYGMTITGTPVDGDTITVVLSFVSKYYLPVLPDELVSVSVDGQEKVQEVINAEVTVGERMSVSVDKDVWRAAVTESGTYTITYDYEYDTWRMNGDPVIPSDYGIIITGEFADGDTITVTYAIGDYHLEDQYVVFFEAPESHYPEVNNTVHVVYSAENPTAMANIMDCTIATVYGGTGSLCIVMAGSLTQPNAYFWNGQTSVYMDPGYFPMTQYQLASDATDPISCFGKQQGYLIILKNGSVGRTTLSTETVDGRTTIDLPYVSINAKTGCDLPYTLQLIENNLTWCTRSQGVMFLANTSAAYENNIICLSQKVNDSGASWNPGLLMELKDKNKVVVSHDDEKRYWLIVGDHAWLWDYYISSYKNPSWFFFDNIKGEAFVQELDQTWHFDSMSRLTLFKRSNYDYDKDTQNGAIDKVFRFATQYFGTYDVLKTVNSVILNVRSDTNSKLRLTYMTDYETREDKTELNGLSWHLVPRDLSFRNLEGSGFAYVFRRKPHCRRIRYFTMRLENNDVLMDMSIVSAQIFYVFHGRQR